MKRYYLFIFSAAILGAGCQVNQDPIDATAQSGQAIHEESSSVTELNLSGRGLTTIPMDIFSRTDLIKLNLSKNKLTGAPQSQVGQLKDLVSLDLSYNSLTGLPAELGQLSRLEVLDLSNNRLTGLPMELGDLTQLRILDVSGNPYSSQDLEKIAQKLSKTEIRK